MNIKNKSVFTNDKRTKQIAEIKAELKLPLTSARRRDLQAILKEAESLLKFSR